MQSHDGPDGRPVLDDDEIVARMRAGDQDGLEGLLRKFGPQVKSRLCRQFRSLGDDDLCESAVYETALAMWNRAHRLNPRRSLFGFMMTTAQRKLRRIAREQAVRPEVRVEQIERFGSPTTDPTPNEFSTDAQRALGELSPLEHDVMAMIVACGRQLSRTELARMLGSTAGSIYDATWSMKRKLQQFLDAHAVTRAGKRQ